LINGAWLSLVERTVRDREVGGSNPLAPTISLEGSLPIVLLAAASIFFERRGFFTGDAAPFLHELHGPKAYQPFSVFTFQVLAVREVHLVLEPVSQPHI
jgi:hypothetical protein